MVRAAPALALLALAPLLAGCIDGVPGLDGPGLTARGAAERAQPRAQAWQADARLMEAVGIEASSAWAQDPGDHGFAFPHDERVGDGRAPAWALAYHSPRANASLELVVFAANGTILADEDPDEDHGPADPGLAGWQVDSPRAVQVAMEDANFSAAARAPDGGLVAVVAGPDADQGDAGGEGGQGPSGEDPFWVLMAGSAQAGTGNMVLVNARTGERIPFSFPAFPGFNMTFPPGFGGPPGRPGGCPGYGFGGAAERTGPAEHPFGVAQGCLDIEVEVEWQGDAPTDRAVVEVLGPGGQALEPEREEEGPGSYVASFRAAGPGEHVLRVQGRSEGPAGVGAPLAVRVSYEARVETHR